MDDVARGRSALPYNADMEWARLLVDLAGHLAWPAAILVIALAFKSQIKGLLSPDDVDFVEAGAGGFKITRRRISDELSAASTDIKAGMSADNATINPEESDRIDRMKAIAAIDPPAAVFASAANFESVLRSRLYELELVPPARGPGHRLKPLIPLLDIARKNGLLTRSQAEGAYRLSKIRNEIAHGYTHVDMDEEQALQFCNLAGELERAVLSSTPAQA